MASATVTIMMTVGLCAQSTLAGAAPAASIPTVPPTAVVAPSPPGPSGLTARETMPYQFIAKAYTELLGRAPAADEWTVAVNFFVAHGCTSGSLAAFGQRVVASAEYRRDYPPSGHGIDDAAVALSLFRFVLNREPDAAGFVAARDDLESGEDTPSEVAANLFSTAEFTDLDTPAICDPSNPSYFFGQPGNWTGFPAIETPEHGLPGPDETEAQLQSALNVRSAAGGGTLYLPTGVVVGLTTTLIIPSNVILSTVGNPDPNRYADMAELVRLGGFTQLPDYSGLELVRLQPGAKVLHVWVDGQRDAPDPNNFLIFNIRMLGGIGTTVKDDRISNTYGASSLEADGADSNIPGAVACSKNVVSDNLVEAYSSVHVAPTGEPDTDHPQADGLGIYCADTSVTGNDIVDISDTGIVLFTGASFLPITPPQLSVVADNHIISAGNSYSFGIATDPSYSLHGGPIPGGDLPGTVTRSFSEGTRASIIENNVLWTGDRTHINVLLSSGSHDLFGSVTRQNCAIPDANDQLDCGGGRNATGARWINNSSDGLLTETEMGIYIGGTQGAIFEHNRFPHLVEVSGGLCPKFPVIVAGDYAPGLRIDEPVHVDTALISDSCVNPQY